MTLKTKPVCYQSLPASQLNELNPNTGGYAPVGAKSRATKPMATTSSMTTLLVS